jgi:hypothetical protein
MDDLQVLGNLYAHHNGDTSSHSKEKMKRVDAIIRARVGVSKSDSFVLVDATYLRSAIDTALNLIKRLGKIHPSTEPPFKELDGEY